MTDTAPLSDDSLGRAIAERQRPLRSRRSSMVDGVARRSAPGMLARRSSSFGLSAGLSLMARRELGMVIPDPAVAGLPVAPPAEWDDSMLPSERVRTGNATLDHIIATQSGARRPSAPQRRGLRSAVLRRNTPTGLNTAPGASARRLRPQSAPPALNPDVRRAVSGDASESRPRAPRSGPRAAAPAGGRSPSSRPGRHARGRDERSAPWQNHSAQHASAGTFPLARRASGPVTMSGRSVPAALEASSRAFGSDAEVGASAMVSGPGPLPIPVAQLVADIADDVAGQPPGPWTASSGLARAASPLAPSVRAPGGPTPSHGVGPATASAARMVERHQPTRSSIGASPARAAASGSARSIPSFAAPAAAGPLAGPGRATAPDGQPSFAAADGSTVGRVDPQAPARAARSAGVAMTAADTTAPSGPAPTLSEPAMAAMLRASPPSISLSSKPRRAFTSAVAGSFATVSDLAARTVSFAPGGPAPVAGRSVANRSVANRSEGSNVLAATSTPQTPDLFGPWAGTAGLTVAPGGAVGFGTSNAPALGASPTQPTVRGLGSVASIVSPRVPSAQQSASRQAGSPIRRRPSGLGSPAQGAPDAPARADHARRVMRTLPDLAIPMAREPIPVLAGMTQARSALTISGAGAAQPPALDAPRGSDRFAEPVGAAGAAAFASTRTMQGPPATPIPGPVPSSAAGSSAPGLLPFTPSPALTPSARLSPMVGATASGTPGGARSSTSPGVPSPLVGQPGPGSTARSTPRGVSPPGAGAGAEPVAPPPVVPLDPGERFDQVLREHAGQALSRLPQRFEPIARAILPRPEQVRISTGAASRKALSSVGKVAATSGNVVHLARTLDDTPQSIDILAHELTHVANPSPLVRFFDDDKDSKEERLAREMGSVMAKAPVGTPPASPPPPPSAGSSSPNGGGAGAPSAGGSPPTPPPSPSSFGGGAGAGGPAPTPPPAGAPPGFLAPWAGEDEKIGDDSAFQLAAAGGPTLDVDRLLDALESRIIRELERRGRRWPRPL